MLVSIKYHAFLNIQSSDDNLMKYLEIFWQLMAKRWFDKRTRLSELYIDAEQNREDERTLWILQRALGPTIKSIKHLPKSLTQKQIRTLEWLMTQIEPLPTTYTFYDNDSQTITSARWLTRFLDVWDVKFHHPEKAAMQSHRSLSGEIKSGQFEDPLVQYYSTYRLDMKAVLKHCRKLSDHTIMQAYTNFGGHRGPFGEYAEKAFKTLLQHLGETPQPTTDTHTDSQADVDYDQLLDCASKYYAIVHAFKMANAEFISALGNASESMTPPKIARTDSRGSIGYTADNVECELNYDVLFGPLQKYVNNLHKLSLHALELKQFLETHYPQSGASTDIFTLSSSRKHRTRKAPTDILCQLLTGIILAANERLKLLHETNLVRTAPQVEDDTNQASALTFVQTDLPLADDERKQLAEQYPTLSKDLESMQSPRKYSQQPTTQPVELTLIATRASSHSTRRHHRHESKHYTTDETMLDHSGRRRASPRAHDTKEAESPRQIATNSPRKLSRTSTPHSVHAGSSRQTLLPSPREERATSPRGTSGHIPGAGIFGEMLERLKR